jgi:Protein of unknown function DUF2625
MKPLEALINSDEPAWPLVTQWVREAEVPVEVLPAEAAAADAALYSTQVTTRSPMGAVVHNCAGLLIDDGWLRVLGAGGHPRFQRSLPQWNEGRGNGFYLVADDVAGGFFAINGHALGEDSGNIYYYAPDSLSWEPCGFGYSQFLVWSMSVNLHQFYETFRWEQWQSEVRRLTGDQAFCILPFLWAEGPPMKERFRGVVPISDTWFLQQDIQRQLDGDQAEIKGAS